MRTAVINGNMVENVIVVDDLTFNPGEGHALVAIGENDPVSIGDSYVKGKFISQTADDTSSVSPQDALDQAAEALKQAMAAVQEAKDNG